MTVSGTARLTLAIIVAVNLVMGFAWVWSRGGQTTHITLEIRGNEVTTYVDGRMTAKQTVDGPTSGGVRLSVKSGQGTPSLPAPSGLDRVLVRDLDSGKTLLDDSFDGPLDPLWTIESHDAFTKDGVLRSEDTAFITRDGPWRNYSVEATYRNILSAGIMVRKHDREGVLLDVVTFRDPEQRLIHVRSDGSHEEVERSRLDIAKGEIMRSMVAVVVRPYPYVLGALALAAIATAALGALFQRRAWTGNIRSLSADGWTAWIAGGIALAAFTTAFVLADRFQLREPNWPDSVAYAFQAKIFAQGRAWAPAPPVVEGFEYFYPSLTSLHDGRWVSIFPWGHPLAIAPAQLIGAPWIMPPLLGGASVALLYAYGRRTYSDGIALAAAALLATSPFFLMQASNLMSHNTAVFYMLASLWLVTESRGRRRLVLGTAAGVLFGLLFNTRPLTAVAVVPLFAMELAWGCWRADTRPRITRNVLAFGVGALIMLFAFFAYNYAVAGDAFSGAYGQSNSMRLGFGGAHSVSRALQNNQTEAAYLALVLGAWPVWVGIIMAAVPFMLGTRDRHDWAFLFTVVSILIGYSFFDENGVMQGPRMWYEAVPFLLLLTARGFLHGADRVDAVVRAFARGDGHDRAITMRPAARALATVCIVALISFGTYSWLFGQRTAWDITYIPARPEELRGFNRVDSRLADLVSASDARHALVLVNGCVQWECYGTAFWRNSPTLDGDIVYARRLEDELQLDRLLAAFPDRYVYVADYRGRYLLPYGMEGKQGSRHVMPEVQAPLASDLRARARP